MSVYTPFWATPDYDRSKPLLLYGFGSYGTYYLKRILAEGIVVRAIFDINPQYHNTEIAGIPVLPPDKIAEFDREFNVFIAVLGYKYTLTKLFRELGYTKIYNEHGFETADIYHRIAHKEEYADIISKNASRIENARKLFLEPKSIEIFDAALDAWGNGNWERLERCYQRDVILPRDIFKWNKHEVFVECGAYEGHGIYQFIEESRHQYDFIYAFEPNELEYTAAQRSFDIYCVARIELHRTAVCDINGTVSFSGDNTQQGAKISESGEVSVPSTTLDTFFSQPGKKIPTIIRMDIEGAEVSALRGAKELIKNYMPNLAISSYHRLQDYWEVPLTIAALGRWPGYELFFRHFRSYYTLCFARPKTQGGPQ